MVDDTSCPSSYIWLMADKLATAGQFWPLKDNEMIYD